MMTESKSEATAKETPIVEEDFAALLKKYRIKADLASNIAENISHTGGPNVFEDPSILTDRLAAWSGDIAPVKRKLILEQWFAEKNIAVPKELLEKAGMSATELKKEEKEKEEKKVRYVYDPDQGVVRMAKQGEVGGTLNQANMLKQMAEESGATNKESPFIMDSQGNWTFNPKARITGTEVMAFEMIKNAQNRGEPVDPIDAMVQAAEKMKVFREAMGGSGGTSWADDPITFVTKMRTLLNEGGGSEALRSEITDLRKTVETMKEDRLVSQITGQQQQIVALNQKITELGDMIKDPSRLPGAKTEMDILFQLASEGTSLLKTELPSFRKDVKDALGNINLPPVKSTAAKEDRKTQFRKNLQADKELEEMGKSLFFSES